MKTLGIIGGLSPQSTIKYYEWLNAAAEEALGADHSAPLVVASVDFGLFSRLKRDGDWDTQAKMLVEAAQGLERAGAQGILLASNTMHRVAGDIETSISIPFLHIADLTAEAIRRDGLTKVGFLGTRYSMESDFYLGRLRSRGVEALVPNAEQRDRIHQVIFQELVRGKVTPRARLDFLRVIDDLAENGAEGVTLGCTEITLLVGQADTSVHVYDTARLHVQGAAHFACSTPS